MIRQPLARIKLMFLQCMHCDAGDTQCGKHLLARQPALEQVFGMF